MNYNNLLYTVEDGILTIMINRPNVYNALSKDTKVELIDAFKRADKDDSVKVIVFTGAGDKAFCAGQDLNESQHESEGTAKKWLGDFDSIYRAIRSVKKPTISSINGYCVGAGLQMALVTDIRIANETAKFGMPEINIGLGCILGTALLWDKIGHARAADMVLTGRLITGEEAEKYGVITRLVPNDQLQEKTKELAKELAEKPPMAFASTKQWIHRLSEELLNESMLLGEEVHTSSYAAGEPQQMMRAFFEKKKSRVR